MSEVIEVGDDFVVTDEYSGKRDKRGLWTGTQVYGIRKMRLGDLMPKIGSKHPFFGWMSLEDTDFTGEEGEWVKVTGQYSGVMPAESSGDGDEDNIEAPPEYVRSITVSEEPLETLPKYVNALTEKEIQEASKLAKEPPVDDDGKPIDVNTTGWDALKLELYNFLRRGVESYRDPKLTWTKRWVSTERPNDISKTGKIDVPDGPAPAAGADRNYLNIGGSTVERGEIFENEESWDLSGRGGWIAEIYE